MAFTGAADVAVLRRRLDMLSRGAQCHSLHDERRALFSWREQWRKMRLRGQYMAVAKRPRRWSHTSLPAGRTI